MGRPTLYTDDILTDICDRLSEGEPLAQICRAEGMPAPRTVRSWMNDDVEGVDAKKVSAAIACAREIGFDAIAVDALEIADATEHDTIRDEETGTERPNGEWISRSRLRVETRLKLLAKWDPKRYGDKTLHGSDPDNPLPTPSVIVSYRDVAGG